MTVTVSTLLFDALTADLGDLRDDEHERMELELDLVQLEELAKRLRAASWPDLGGYREWCEGMAARIGIARATIITADARGEVFSMIVRVEATIRTRIEALAKLERMRWAS